MGNWKNATAIITGGGSGIGRALAKVMSARGTRVLVTDINQQTAERVATECGSLASAASLDVRDADGVSAVVEKFARDTGRLDYIFNNAGIGVAGEVDEIPLQAWQHIIDINLCGVLHGVLAAYPLMVKQGSGHIINTASMAGLGPAPLLTPYAMTKHAVVGLSTSLRLEGAARGVRVSVLCPSAIETPLLDSGNPADVAIAWAPDVRRFLSALTGPPYPVEKCAEQTLDAIDDNKSIIVLPGRARLAWRLGRLFPNMVEKLVLGTVAAERSNRS